jgi:uncharacterized membrane protein YqiK
MNTFGLFSIGGAALLIVICIITVGFILARLYRRATKEVSYVRTGFGGQKVIMNGGSLVFPVLHDTIPVNMNTLRLAVSRRDDQALITRDRMRVDVVAEFYVRTQPTAESIANAAQTLGERTMQPETLKELVEGKFVDALRCVAAEMTMEELHEKRTDFIQKVQQAVTEDLLKNGLELETVSLTALDQTNKSFFNPNNAFDAEGLTRLTEEIELRRKIRNDIEQDTNVQIKAKKMEAEKKNLEIEREEQFARLKQEREVEIRRAAQTSEIAKEQAENRKIAEQSEIVAKQEIEHSRIEMERSIQEKEIEKSRAIETQGVEKHKAIQLAQQSREIAIAEKSKEQSEAEALADKARAIAVQAEEKVKTARDTEAAERKKQIELILAKQNAEREAIKIQVSAESEKIAAADQASAIRELAQAESDKERIKAEGESEAEKVRAAAAEIRYNVEAEGQRALNEAANLLSSEQITMKVKLNLIEHLDSIIRESVKPMENIDGIKIIQLAGLGGVTGATTGGAMGTVSDNGSLADQVVNGALKYRAQAPLLDSLLKEVGIKGGDINGLTQVLKDELTPSEASVNSKLDSDLDGI